MVRGKKEIVYFLIILMQGNGLFYGSGMLHLMLSLWCLPAQSLEQNTGDVACHFYLVKKSRAVFQD